MMDIKELRQLTEAKLQAQLNKCRKDYAKAREEVWSGQERNVREVRNLRRQCARVLTVLREKKQKQV